MLDALRRRGELRREALAEIDDFVARSRAAVHVRRVDGLLMVRPDKTLGLNPSGVEILAALYDRDGLGAEPALRSLAPRLGVRWARLVDDARDLVRAVAAVMREDFTTPRKGLSFGAYEPGRVRYPVLAEIALTYACNNRCTFCYAASPTRPPDPRPMSTAEVERVMDRIWHEAHVPSLSFTGGEATLRKDLPELIAHGKALGFRVNLITNGLRCGESSYAEALVGAGLDSAQVSIEAGEPVLHDRLVGRSGAFAQTTAAVGHFQRLGIHVHTNTTLCQDNLEAAPDLIRFLARELGTRTLSMNLLIRTGNGLDEAAGPLSYTELAEHLPKLLEVATQEEMTLVWYSPVPYCIVNPVLLGQGAKSCACVHGILSVDPAGQVLPCSSFDQGLGSLLETPFQELYDSPEARWWRERRYLPPSCADCADADLCAGACPLYWDAAEDFSELGCRDAAARRRWEEERERGGSFGVPKPSQRSA